LCTIIFENYLFLTISVLEVYKNKNKFNVTHNIFTVAAEENLTGVTTCGEGRRRAGNSYELDAAQSI
jgi:hypothetical protein